MNNSNARLALTASFLLSLALPALAQDDDLKGDFKIEAHGESKRFQRTQVGPASDVTGHKVAAVQAADEGPTAALEFERKYRGPKYGKAYGYSQEGLYPQARGIPLTDMKHIIPMTEKLWSREQILADFKKNRTPEQVGVIVMAKTEFCCTNKFRPCAVTTAALEKRSTQLVKRFRVYGAWIKNPAALPNATAQERAAKAAWDEDVIEEYAFEQGPGATLDILIPATGQMIHTDAQQLQLDMEPFEKEQGRTPLLETFLQGMLAKIQTQPASPAISK